MGAEQPLGAELSAYISARRPSPLEASVGRVLDVTLAASALIILAPMLLLAMLAIWSDNPRASVLFRQVRYGYSGKPFILFKLRTMVPDAEALKSTYANLSVENGPGFKILGDPRITAVGRILRRYYIDEIPQFFNVLRGEMSIVGPRANSYNPLGYEPWQRVRLSVKPGMTGLWQTRLDKPLAFEERCKLDLEYIKHKGILTDITIMLRTFWIVLVQPSGD